MGYIDEAQISSYTTRHNDWLAVEPWRALAEVAGQAAAKTFYIKQEAKCKVIDTTFPMDSWLNPLTWLQNWLLSTERRHYSENAVLTYDEAALQVLKNTERLLSYVGEAKAEFQKAVNDAKAYLQNNYITPLTDKINKELTPAVNTIKSSVDSVKLQVANVQNAAAQAQTLASNAQGYAQTAYNNAASAVSKAESSLSKVADAEKTINKIIADLQTKADSLSTLQTKYNQLVNDVNNKTATINTILNDLSSKTSTLKDIQTRLKALEQTAGTTTPSSSSLFDRFLKRD